MNTKLDALYPFIDERKNKRSLGRIKTEELLKNQPLNEFYHSIFGLDLEEKTGTEGKRLQQMAQEAITNFTDLAKDRRIGIFKSALQTICLQESMPFTEHIFEKQIESSGEEILLHFIIPKIIKNHIATYQLMPNETKLNHHIFTRFINLLSSIDEISESPYKEKLLKLKSLTRLKPSNYKKKAIVYFLQEMDAINQLATIIDCDIILQEILVLEDQDKENLKPIIQKLSSLAALHPTPSEAMQIFQQKLPSTQIFSDEKHPFYYWLKTVSTAQQVQQLLNAYNQAFPETTKSSIQPFVDMLSQQDPETIHSFIKETAIHIKRKSLNVTVERQIAILIALIKQGYFLPQLNTTTQYKDILSKLGASPAERFQCYERIADRNTEYAEIFLQDLVKEKSTGMKNWLATNHPELLVKKTPNHSKAYYPVAEASPSPTPIDHTPAIKKPLVNPPPVKTKNQAPVVNSQPQLMNKKESKTLQPPQKQASTATRDTNKKITAPPERNFFQKIIDVAQEAQKKVARTIIAQAPQRLEYPSWASAVKGLKPSSVSNSQQPTTQVSPSPELPPATSVTRIFLQLGTNQIKESEQLFAKIVSFLDELKYSTTNWQDIIDKYPEKKATPSVKIELLIAVAKQPEITKTHLTAFLRLITSNLSHDLHLFFTSIPEQQFKNSCFIEDISFLLTSPSKIPAPLISALQEMLFFESKEASAFYISGKILEQNGFNYCAAVLYELGNSAPCLDALKQLPNLSSNFIDFAAITKPNQCLITNILLHQHTFQNLPHRFIEATLKNPLKAGDYLRALYHYFTAIDSLYDSGWAGKEAPNVFIPLFNELVHVLLNFNVLLLAITADKSRGHAFCLTMSQLLDKSFKIERANCLYAPPINSDYMDARRVYFHAFNTEKKRFGIDPSPSDAHFSAYFQLKMTSPQLPIENMLDAIHHMGKYQALIVASTYLDPDNFYALLTMESTESLTPQI